MSEARDRMLGLCVAAMRGRGLDSDAHKERMKLEIREIDAQEGHDFVLGLHDKLKSIGKTYPTNQVNLLTYELLDIAPAADISRPPAYTEGELPDIDVDYLSPIRDYLKHVWAPRTFGRDNVCSIGSYTTFGLKSAFIDMAKVFSCDRDEIMSLTTKLGLKDEDGKTLTFDKALEEYPELNAYCERNPEVADAVKKCLHRNRGMGVHAGGLIVSRSRIDSLVPLVQGKEGGPVSAWVEGLHGQDLGPVGLIKFDLLVIANLMQIALCCKLVKERHGMKHLWSDPSIDRDWSDTSYLEDPLALKLANDGDLLGIFQFDSHGIRKLVRGNVKCFNDLTALSALYRPGPLNCGMHTRYIERMHGREEFVIHPILLPILGKTYGVMVFQESVMQVLHVVGRIPLKDSYDVIKAISKKNIDKFAKHKDMFISNGQETLGCSQEDMEYLWSQVESFSGYGFNLSHSVAYTYISMKLLALKSHYPIEFFTATLQCEKINEKIKEYMIDARRRGIAIERVHVGQSRENFVIGPRGDGEAIYYGFGKLKGLGKDAAAKIAAGQPYSGIDDFLERFGTDSRVAAPLIALGVFGKNRADIFRFYDQFKDNVSKIADRRKRHAVSNEKHHQKLHQRLMGFYPPGTPIRAGYGDDQYEQYAADLSPQQMIILEDMRSIYYRFIEIHAKKEELGKSLTYPEFNPDLFDLSEKWETLLSQPMEFSENSYYGFRWTHPLELSPDYSEDRRRTFQMHRESAEEGYRSSYVEIEVEKVEEKPTKKGGVYFLMTASDVLGEVNLVTVWEDDYSRFKDMLVEKALVKIMLDAPDNGYPTYKMQGPPRHLRHRLPPKDMDFRVVEYRRSED